LFFSCSGSDKEVVKKQPGEIDIIWKKEIPGNFSFKDEWSYPEGVYKNNFGQLSCDGFCPERVDAMKDKNGKLIKDSLEHFYKLVDTTHQYHSFRSETNAYEWSGNEYFKMTRIGHDAFEGYSMCDAGTHSSLKLVIDKSVCLPLVSLNSITSSGLHTYHCKGGQIEIDTLLFAKGVMKANFDFRFENKTDSTPMYWKGQIYTPIK
jgi:hypothetical protein